MLLNLNLNAQQTTEKTDPKWQFGIRMNHIALIDGSDPLYRYNYAKNSLGIYYNYNTPFRNLKLKKNNYYYFGISAARLKGNWFYSLHVDYYYNRRKSHHLYYTESTKAIQENESGMKDTGMLLALGAGKTMKWKCINLKLGMELSGYIDWLTKVWVSHKNYTVNVPASWDKITMISPPGGYIKPAIITGIDCNINKQFSLGMEFSSGLIFYFIKGGYNYIKDYYAANGTLYNTTSGNTYYPIKVNSNIDLLAPSLRMAYTL